MGTDATTQPLIPEALPPQRGEVSDRAYRRGYIPKTYSAQDVDEAKRVIAHWNKTFGGVKGAKRANPADACNVKAYVKMLRLRDKSEGLFNFDERVVCAAISAYGRARYNVQLQSWKHFSDWISCENVDAMAGEARITAHQVDHRPRDKTVRTNMAARAKRILDHEGLCTFLASCHKNRITVEAALAKVCPGTGGRMDQFAAKLRGLLAQREALSMEDRSTLEGRAKRCFAAYFSHPPGQQTTDAPVLVGISLALLDLDASKGAAQ